LSAEWTSTMLAIFSPMISPITWLNRSIWMYYRQPSHAILAMIVCTASADRQAIGRMSHVALLMTCDIRHATCDMRISSKGEYGLRALFDLTQRYGAGPVQSHDIHMRQDID